MNLEKINYWELNAKQKEVFNFHQVASFLVEYGFNCIKLADDWQGADFLAYHFSGEETLKVQLKARMSIDKKYLDKDLYITFSILKNWYLIRHDELINIVRNEMYWFSEKWNFGKKEIRVKVV